MQQQQLRSSFPNVQQQSSSLRASGIGICLFCSSEKERNRGPVDDPKTGLRKNPLKDWDHIRKRRPKSLKNLDLRASISLSTEKRLVLDDPDLCFDNALKVCRRRNQSPEKFVKTFIVQGRE